MRFECRVFRSCFLHLQSWIDFDGSCRSIVILKEICGKINAKINNGLLTESLIKRFLFGTIVKVQELE